MRWIILIASAWTAAQPAGRPASEVKRIYFCAMSADGAQASGTVPAAALGRLFAFARAGAEPIRILDEGASVEAKARVRALAGEFLAQAAAGVKASLRSSGVFLVVIPQDRNLTDLAPFRSLRGVKLPDGRVWDEIRGVGFVSQPDGTVAVGLGEENLLARPRRHDGYPKGYLLAHEASHAVHAYGLDPAAAGSVEARYAARVAAGLPFPSRYAASNAYEYFAVSASVFFGLSMDGSDSEQDAAWLRVQDSDGFSALEGIYGSSRPLR